MNNAIPFRVGQGFDVHKLVEGRKCILGGVDIPFEKGLLGHSDADVLLHAISDALLGAIGSGDIGMHFPDTDTRWKGADSLKLLARVGEIVREAGFEIGNVQGTVICERPKIRPHVEAMRANIAGALGIEVDQVGIQGTTTEKLGFTGRGEGIAAQSVALVAKVGR
ncbi:MAG: 2-C-methyl-D-erythritol 2,4-cyclodiphosphate synthase [Fibrobacteres bacterium]|jgi:2-C-methyl-D-erythritol 2,4-cyclodiphosphate synthase|nr:2-C-methyl-D-erythritol 2,4-cyclodiphosphate synthase [Fibrobacterota bacterium]